MVLLRDYIRTARAKGLSERALIFKHALKNTTIPVVTLAGLQMGAVLTGAVITERIFAWPGICSPRAQPDLAQLQAQSARRHGDSGPGPDRPGGHLGAGALAA